VVGTKGKRVTMPPRKAIVDGSSLAVLTEEIRNLGREFRDWREQVYLPGHARLEDSDETNRLGRQQDATTLAGIETDKWGENARAHEKIIERLDSLNGFKNKIMGICAVMVFSAPTAVAVWALVTRA
jgi:hypothetical protein